MHNRTDVCFGKEITGTKPKTPKTALVSSSSEVDFCSLETSDNRRMAQRPKMFDWAKGLQ
jgi:hypothetical protein